MRKILNIFILAALLGSLGLHTAHAQQKFEKADVYYNEACGGCAVYLKEKLVPYLETQGLKVTMRDYVNEKQARKDMNQLHESLGIPLELQSHIMTFIDGGQLALGGHVPLERVKELFTANKLPDRLVVYQDAMLEMGVNPENASYTVWQPDVEVKKYPLQEPITIYLNDWKSGSLKSSAWQEKSLLPLVLTTGLLDGVNPCAIAVLIFFIAFLFTLQSKMARIFKYGIVYIAVIYLTYLGIGFGLFKAIIISGEPHLMAKIGAWLVLILGLINIIGYYAPKFPIKMQIPRFSQGTLKHWLTKATLPAVIIGAFLVGLCTFPCSGGIYVAIVGLLAAKGTFMQGLGYMLIYNAMFVVPLIVLLALAGNKYTLGRVAEWQSKSDKGLKFWSGVTMIALGIIILIWFT